MGLLPRLPRSPSECQNTWLNHLTLATIIAISSALGACSSQRDSAPAAASPGTPTAAAEPLGTPSKASNQPSLQAPTPELIIESETLVPEMTGAQQSIGAEALATNVVTTEGDQPFTINLDCDSAQGQVLHLNSALASSDSLHDDAAYSNSGISNVPSEQLIFAQRPAAMQANGLAPLASGATTMAAAELVLPYGTPIATTTTGGSSQNPEITINGQFCPTPVAAPTQTTTKVLFLVDFSASMGAHFPGRSQAEATGNDPLINRTCGRLQAAQRIIAKLKDQDNVEAAMIPFAAGVVTDRVVFMQDIASFAAHLNPETFCYYAVGNPQDFGLHPENPGGFLPQIQDLSAPHAAVTNYKYALRAAQTLLADEYGRKVIYFITDGEPTTDGEAFQNVPQAIAAGIAASERLRARVDNLVVNALLIGAENPQAIATLQAITGNRNRVRRADDAADLVDEITQFPEPQMVPDTLQAKLVSPDNHSVDIAISAAGWLSREPSALWYQTEPQALVGAAVGVAPAGDYRFLIQAKDVLGESFSSEIIVRWRP